MFTKGEGAYLYADNGDKYLDFVSGVAVNALGHAHPYLIEKLKEQSEKLWHCSNLYQVEGQIRLSQRLCDISFADYAFFCNSGTEAMEAVIKLVRKYHYVSGRPECHEIITFDNAFHGRTLAALAATGNPKYLEGFAPHMPGFAQAEFNNIESVKKLINPKTAGILIEPIQGEGGARGATPEFMQGLRKLCDEFSLLLMVDEVQCGMGRTGKMFAYEWYDGVLPDVMVLAKGLGGGFPVGACLATEEAAKGMKAGTHGSTFGGNPLAMAVANGVLDLMLADGFLAGVRKTSDYFRAQLKEFLKRHHNKDFFEEEVRGQGLLIGIPAKLANDQFVQKCRDQKLLIAVAGQNVVRIIPPLIIDHHHIDEAIKIMDHVSQNWESQ